MAYLNTFFFEDYWNIGIIEDDISHIFENRSPNIEWFPKTKKGQFLADPFIILDPLDNSIVHIFCEIYLYKKNKGTIGYLTYNAKLKEYSEPTIVLEEDHHLAYPFIIEDDGTIFMVPETAENTEVAIYKAIDFPLQWKKEKILIDNYPGVDNSFLFYDEYWWLFSTDMRKGEHSYLNIFYSESLLGEWRPHLQNPVKSKNKINRCAGTPFKHEGNLIRPSMDCENKYGEKIFLNHIKVLNKKEFQEEMTGKIDPFKSSFFKDKTHTLSKSGNFIVVDGCKERFFCSNSHLFKHKLNTLLKKVRSKFT